MSTMAIKNKLTPLSKKKSTPEKGSAAALIGQNIFCEGPKEEEGSKEVISILKLLPSNGCGWVNAVWLKR
jgi:hypothetical protein